MAQGTSGVGDLVEAAIESRLFPGAAVVVTAGERTVLDRAWGRLTYAPWSPRVTPATVYDLASLTKPLATALSLLALVSRGVLSLETPLGAVWADAPPDKRDISIRHLLGHRSGLPAHRSYHPGLLKEAPAGRRLLLRKLLLHEPLVNPPGAATLYSDVGFMVLGLVVEDLIGTSLPEAAETLVFRPLGVSGLFFPGAGVRKEDAPALDAVAPTEVCPWRNRVIQGEVNDLNAWALGGCAGHAGLFGTAGAVAGLLARLLDVFTGRLRCSGFPGALLAEFWTVQPGDSDCTWALGFDTPSPLGSTAGTRFSRRSVGHLGFTGTSFWLDLERHVAAVFLSNRTFPCAADGKTEMRDFRAGLHDLVRRMW